ncbi:MAG: cupin domain-containing protein [Armatimonadota bacterium]|nr:cupin domain-containing protein [Armatimonadota bacterium]
MPIVVDGAEQIAERRLISLQHSGGHFDIRSIRIGVGGRSALHSHPWPQANYVISGHGRICLGDRELPVGPGDFVFVQGHVRHRFLNTSREELIFLAIRGSSETALPR